MKRTLKTPKGCDSNTNGNSKTIKPSPYAKTNTLRRSKSGRAPTGPEDFDYALLFISFLTGMLSWILFLRHIYNINLIKPVKIGILFGFLSLLLLLVVYVHSIRAGTFRENLITGSSGFFGMLLGALLMMSISFGAGTLFEWVYELQFSSFTKPTSYVFVIDDSGSMHDTDPDGKRYDAIQSILENEDSSFPYMVYSFSNGARIRRDMAPASTGNLVTGGDDNGGTNIFNALITVSDDFDRNKWNGGDCPKVILLTDGLDNELAASVDKIVDEYNKRHFSLSTVGLSITDSYVFSNMAEKTGGSYVDSGDATQLVGAINEAKSIKKNYDLLSYRGYLKYSLPYSFMRVIFLAVIGVLITLTSMFGYGAGDSAKLTMASGIIKALVISFMFELLMEHSVIKNQLNVALFALFAMTIAKCKVTRRDIRSLEKTSQKLRM